MFGLVLVMVLGVTVLVGTTLGGRYSVAPPVLLIVLGGLLGLVPRLSEVHLDPDVVLLLFLPPILYWESLNTSLREIRANLRVIALSSVGLVVLTMVVVSFTAQALGVSAPAAWILGAVLAPTDAAAIAGLAKRMPRRTLTTLRAESLVNDGTALVLFAVVVGAAYGEHAPTWAELLGRFAGSYVGGVVAGLLMSGVVVWVRRRLDDPLREGALSILTPFGAFLLAEILHASGVLAVVVAGLVMSYEGPRVIRARSRVQAFAFWDLSTFLVNGGLFVLVGMQFAGAVRNISGTSLARPLGVALTVTVAVVGTRLAFVHVTAWLVRALDRRPAQRTRRVGWRPRTASGWAGFRGAVSLAAALATPTTTGAGAPFQDRDLIVFTTCVVILLTILVQGTTLPAVIRWAGLIGDDDRAREVHLARVRAAEAGLEALPRVAATLGIDADVAEQVKAEYEAHVDETRSDEDSEEGREASAARDQARRLRLGVLEHKRRAVTELRDANHIDDIVLRELQAGMDIEEVRLLGPASAE